MDTGTIKKLLNGFGFIAREGSSDLFFSASEVDGVNFDDLREGDTVSFTPGEGPKGPNATKVARVDGGGDSAPAEEAAAEEAPAEETSEESDTAA